MENSIVYSYAGVTYNHKGDQIEISFDDSIQSQILNDQLSANEFAWEVNTFFRDELLPYNKVETTSSGYKFDIFNVVSDPFEDEDSEEYKIRTQDEFGYLQYILKLPKPLSGHVEIKPKGVNAYDPDYKIQVLFLEKGSRTHRPYETAGLILKSINNLYGLDFYQARAFSEYRKYLSKLNYTANDHYRLVGHLKKTSSDEITKDENRFKDLIVSDVQKIKLNITQLENGDLKLSPNLIGVKSKDEQSLNREISLINDSDLTKTLHVGKELIQVEPNEMGGIKEIRSVETIKKEDKDAFFESPGSFIDADLVDLDGFSYRVQGITEYIHADYADLSDGNNDWFISNNPIILDEFEPFIESENELDDFEEKSIKASDNNASQIAFKNKVFNIPEKEELHERIDKLRVDLANKELEEPVKKETKKAVTFNIKYLDGGNDLHNQFEEFEIPNSTLNHLKYQPYSYQKYAINWIYSLYRSSIKDGSQVKGGVLADDMGLGKTISSLLGLKSIIEFQKSINPDDYLTNNKCFMVVAPLSLLKNWKEEINKFFEVNPFSDIVILNSQNDLNKFRFEKGTERKQIVDGKNPVLPSKLKKCLNVGESFGFDRLDQPGRLILTTYETMRDYQFSLAAMQFYCVIFDEAQKIKNPGALATHAAKALNSDINIMATGTPVENNLLEYWCIMDTANPKLFGTKEEFEEQFITPIKNDDSDEVKLRVGKELYAKSGPFLLRRSKEELRDELGKNLPNKYEFKGLKLEGYNYLDTLDKPLTAKQILQYEKVREEKEKDPSPGAALNGLHRLKACMIHPELTFTNKVDHLANITRDQFWNESAKLQSLLSMLHTIKNKNEKVIIFSISRSIQNLTKKWLKIESGLDVDIISGDTKVESTRQEETRLGIIKKFSSNPGFNIIILSPLAAGVGLNVIAANHIFHLERHWNPAKEAQANDRAYRIGQQKDVNIYYPIGKHPTYDSFDIKIDGLLSRKTFIKDALITFPKTTENDIAKEVW